MKKCNIYIHVWHLGDLGKLLNKNQINEDRQYINDIEINKELII